MKKKAFLTLFLLIGIIFSIIYSIMLSVEMEGRISILKGHMAEVEKEFEKKQFISLTGIDIVKRIRSYKNAPNDFSGTSKKIIDVMNNSKTRFSPPNDIKLAIPMFWDKHPKYNNTYCVIFSDFRWCRIPAKKFKVFLDNNEMTNSQNLWENCNWGEESVVFFSAFLDFIKHCFSKLTGFEVNCSE